LPPKKSVLVNNPIFYRTPIIIIRHSTPNSAVTFLMKGALTILLFFYCLVATAQSFLTGGKSYSVCIPYNFRVGTIGYADIDLFCYGKPGTQVEMRNDSTGFLYTGVIGAAELLRVTLPRNLSMRFEGKYSRAVFVFL
jgi:hypothetical protein